MHRCSTSATGGHARARGAARICELSQPPPARNNNNCPLFLRNMCMRPRTSPRPSRAWCWWRQEYAKKRGAASAGK